MNLTTHTTREPQVRCDALARRWWKSGWMRATRARKWDRALGQPTDASIKIIAHYNRYCHARYQIANAPSAEVSDRRAHSPENTTGANGGSLH